MASLREQLRELDNPNPSFEDPEDFISRTNAKVIENDTEISSGDVNNQFGSLRNRLPTLLELDAKYHGTRISRKDYGQDETEKPQTAEKLVADDEASSEFSFEGLEDAGIILIWLYCINKIKKKPTCYSMSCIGRRLIISPHSPLVSSYSPYLKQVNFIYSVSQVSLPFKNLQQF